MGTTNLTQRKFLSLAIITSVLAVYLIFTPAMSTAATMYFFTTNLLPPANGMYLCPDPCFALYPNGCFVRNWCNRLFSASIPPPLPGFPVTHSFSARAEFELSPDAGSSWQPVVVKNISETMYIQYLGYDSNDGSNVYFAEITQLDVAGGELPACVQIRESPILTSSGQIRIRPVNGGYQISSFFDIYTEISTDCGGAWWPTFSGPGHVELKIDPELVTQVDAPGTALPMPLGQYVTPAEYHQAYQNGMVIKDVRHKLFTDWNQPPPFGRTDTHTFDSVMYFKVLVDGNFVPMHAPATMTVKISNIRHFIDRDIYETEATQLDIFGGDLPPNVMIRESPTKVSQGGTSMIPASGIGGVAAISSFFDIFTEVSTDGGGTWFQDVNGPAHVELVHISDDVGFSDPNVLPIGSEYFGIDPCFALFATDAQLYNFILRDFAHSYPLPPEGNTVTHSFSATAKILLSLDGGLTFTPVKTPADITVSITGRAPADGNTHYYDTEMTQLDISGGSLPSGVQIRESPTKASSGRISQRPGYFGGYQVSSFFDIWLELSTDGGYSWVPTVSGQGTVAIWHDSCNKCPNFNRIGRTNMADYMILAYAWRWTESPGDPINIADLDCDGRVNMTDLDVFADDWLKQTCPQR